MRWRERVVVFALMLSAVYVLFWVPFGRQEYRGPDAWNGEPAFVGGRAWADVQTLAVRFPRRWSGSPDRHAAADWLAGILNEIGLEVHRETFSAALGQSERVLLENVWGVSRGSKRSEEIVVALGNYDMAPTSFQAASDTAGHVGTVLELARVIHASPHRRTFVFFFPDGEEWGMLGARHFARTFADRERIVAALSIEDLDPGRFRALGIDGIGQFSGYAPMWLRSLAADAAAREGYPTEDVPPVFEWLQRAVLVSSTDQGPFLGAQIPAIDLAGRTHDQALKDAVYHMPSDTIEKIRPDAVLAFGRIQERIIRAIDSMAEVPRESDVYLRLDARQIVSGGGVSVPQVLVFGPLVASLVFRMRRGVTRDAFVRETIMLAGLLAVLLVWLAAVKLLPGAGLMPRYELYPPPPRHPLLTSVLWLPVLASAAVLAAVGWIAHRALLTTRWSKEGDSNQAGITVPLVWLLVVAGVGLIDNAFAAVTFLLLPSFLWIWIPPASGRFSRVVSALLVAVGFAVVAQLFVQYATVNLRIGWYILWYMFMAIAYGQFTLLRIVLALATVAIALRLLARGTLNPQPALRLDQLH